jgi:hypothetical protein
LKEQVMRIVHVVDAAQAQAQVQQRVPPPPTASPPRRVQAVNRQADPDDPTGSATSAPDDGISLALSPEAHQAARQAAIEEFQASQARRGGNPEEKAPTPDPDDEIRVARQQEAVRQMQQLDHEVRATQQVHAAAAGGLGSMPTFTYRVGPDGRLYAVSGEVRIDTTAVPGDPEATLRKARQIEELAFSPGDSSPEDRRAAAVAATLAARARQELARQQEARELGAERVTAGVNERG